MPESEKITQLLAQWRGGDNEALNALMALVYDELRRRARACMRAENIGHTLQPTALINEAYLKLAGQKPTDWKDRAHFFAVASQVIRHILVDHARSRHRQKRGGPMLRVELSDDMAATSANGFDLMGLDAALERLTAFDAQQGRIVELRFYGGLSIEETAEALHISPATVKREWVMARAWLYRELSSNS